jgi:acyl-CoA thioester hydrolase
MERSLFRHTTRIRVRNYEIDWQGIVHNAIYLLYFETGRLEYLRHIGVNVDLSGIRNESRVIVARNEVNYKSSAKFDDLLDISTRISYIRNTSFAFEGIIEENSTRRLIAENVSVHVWLDPQSGSPVRVNDDFRGLVRSFEGNSVLIDPGPARMA